MGERNQQERCYGWVQRTAMQLHKACEQSSRKHSLAERERRDSKEGVGKRLGEVTGRATQLSLHEFLGVCVYVHVLSNMALTSPMTREPV
jgi:hypothetical protein